MSENRKKILIISVWADKLYDKRKELIDDLVNRDYDVVIAGSEFSKTEESKFPSKHIKAEYISINRFNINPIIEIKGLMSTKKKLKNINPDIILVYGVKILPSSIVAAKLAKVNCIYSYINGAGNLFLQKTRKIKLLRLIAFPMLWLSFAFSKKIFFQNKDDVEEFARYHLFSIKKAVIVNGSGVNMDFYNPSPFRDQITFSFIGRIVAEKGINDFLYAAEIVKRKYDSTKFIVAGILDENNKAVNELLNYAVKKNIVEFVGEVENSNEILNKTSVFVLPSYREGLPRVNLEAMSKKRAIITTDAVGCRDTVIDGYNGFLININDYEQLADKMIEFIKNTNLINEMGENGFVLCKEKFDVYKVNEKLLNIICEEKIK